VYEKENLKEKTTAAYFNNHSRTYKKAEGRGLLLKGLRRPGCLRSKRPEEKVPKRKKGLW